MCLTIQELVEDVPGNIVMHYEESDTDSGPYAFESLNLKKFKVYVTKKSRQEFQNYLKTAISLMS